MLTFPIMSDLSGSIIKNSEPKPTTSSEVGIFGETIAKEYLKKIGCKIVLANFKAPIGRNRKGVQVTGEIDLIAFDKNTLCFIEVKTRSSDVFLSPLSAIDIRKQRQITRTARVYRKTFNLDKIKFRYDAISIVLNGKKAPKVEHKKGFWNENKFKKKYWSDQF